MMPREGLGIRSSPGGSNLNWLGGILSSQVSSKRVGSKRQVAGDDVADDYEGEGDY